MLVLFTEVLTRTCRARWRTNSNSSISNTHPPAKGHTPNTRMTTTKKCSRCMAQLSAKLFRYLSIWFPTALTTKCHNMHTDTVQISLPFTRRVARACPTTTTVSQTSLRLQSSTAQAMARSFTLLMTMDHLQSSDSLACPNLQQSPKARSSSSHPRTTRCLLS
jgi:hypothetical protein